MAFRDVQAAASASATVNTALKILRRIFRSARQDGYLLSDPAEGVKTVKNRGARERRPFTIDELRRVIDVAGEEWRSLIRFGLYTGQRLGDLGALTWAQVDLQRDEIVITVRKTGKRLIIPIAAPLREHILSLSVADDLRVPCIPMRLRSSQRSTEGWGRSPINSASSWWMQVSGNVELIGVVALDWMENAPGSI